MKGEERVHPKADECWSPVTLAGLVIKACWKHGVSVVGPIEDVRAACSKEGILPAAPPKED